MQQHKPEVSKEEVVVDVAKTKLSERLEIFNQQRAFSY